MWKNQQYWQQINILDNPPVDINWHTNAPTSVIKINK